MRGGQDDEYRPVQRDKESSDEQDEFFGYQNFREGDDKLGWMVTYSQVCRRPCGGVNPLATKHYYTSLQRTLRWFAHVEALGR